MQAAQRLAAEADAEQAAEDTAETLPAPSRKVAGASVCVVCGYRISRSNRFCGMCGVAIEGNGEGCEDFEDNENLSAGSATSTAISAEPARGQSSPPPRIQSEMHTPPPERHANGHPETHHYHHHYHHHFFPGGAEAMAPGAVSRPASDPAREVDRFRPTAALRGDMSRAEAAVRRIAQEWMVACNIKHLDDLLDLYTADALVLRSNCPPIRGAAAVREFFFGALDAGLGEVELDPLRVDVIGEMAYEAGRFKALVPSATGKRREERGKYLWVLQRQSGGDWKLVSDCWSSDLNLTMLEADVPAGIAVKSSQPRKS